MYDSTDSFLAIEEADRFWRKFRACIDYEVYVCDLPEYRDSDWTSAVTRMRMLGICSVDVCGITTVRATWGFFLIPGPGYPELKITFFQIAPKPERQRILDELMNILQPALERSWQAKRLSG